MDKNLEDTLKDFFAPFKNNKIQEEERENKRQKELEEDIRFYSNRDERGCSL